MYTKEARIAEVNRSIAEADDQLAAAKLDLASADRAVAEADAMSPGLEELLRRQIVARVRLEKLGQHRHRLLGELAKADSPAAMQHETKMKALVAKLQELGRRADADAREAKRRFDAYTKEAAQLAEAAHREEVAMLEARGQHREVTLLRCVHGVSFHGVGWAGYADGDGLEAASRVLADLPHGPGGVSSVHAGAAASQAQAATARITQMANSAIAVARRVISRA